MSNLDTTRPQYAGVRGLGPLGGASLVLRFLFHNARFVVVAASPDDDAGEALVPEDYDFDESIEGKILNEIYDLCSYDSDKPWPQENAEPSSRLRKQLADLAADACLSAMQQLAPTPVPEAQTLQDFLYPPTYTLQIFTDGDRLACRTLHNYTGLQERHPPISAGKLRGMSLDLETTDLRVVKPSEIMLVRRLQHFVWKVTVGGEEMVCKASLDLFEHAIGDELATYLKIRAVAANGVKLRVPELKGIIRSHRGVVGILLSHIPHTHRSLGALLAGVEDGSVAPTEATPALRQKWARQIRETVEGLHALGILWRDVKTDNVLIDDGTGDAVVLDFGGGNTVGWVDNERYGTVEGEEEGVGRVLEALGV